MYAAVTAAGGLSDAYQVLRHAAAWWIVPAVAAVTLRFTFIGVQLRLLRGRGDCPSTRLALGISLITFGLGGILPASPAEGITISIVELKRRGMPPRQSGLMLVASQWIQFWTLIIIFAVDRVVVVASGEFHRRRPERVVVFSIVLLAVVAAVINLSRRESVGRRVALATRWFPGQRRKTRERLEAEGVALQHDLVTCFGSPLNRLLVSVLTVAAWLLDAAVLRSMLRSVHGAVSYEVAVLAYSVAIAVGWVPLLPSGLGLVELAVPAVLQRFGVPLASGLAAVLLWRAVSLLLPAAGGLIVSAALGIVGSDTRPAVEV